MRHLNLAKLIHYKSMALNNIMKIVTVPYDCLIGYQIKELLHQVKEYTLVHLYNISAQI